jgi:hypothetical protein
MDARSQPRRRGDRPLQLGHRSVGLAKPIVTGENDRTFPTGSHECTGLPRPLEPVDRTSPTRLLEVSASGLHEIHRSVATRGLLHAHRQSPQSECHRAPCSRLGPTHRSDSGHGFGSAGRCARRHLVQRQFRLGGLSVGCQLARVLEPIPESFARYDTQQPVDVECHELELPIYDQVLAPASGGVRR